MHRGTWRIRAAVAMGLLGGTALPGGAGAQRAVVPPVATRTPPPPPPAAWAALIGEYGADSSSAGMILQRNGKLVWRRDSVEQPLRAGRAGRFFAGADSLTVTRNASGRVTGVSLNGIAWPRRSLGPEAGAVFRIVPVRPIAPLRAEALAATPPEEQGDFLPADLVEVVSLDPTIHLDIRYATSRNFMGEPLYTQPRAFLQRPAAEALRRAHRELRGLGYGLLIHDGYRPWYVTKMFWEATPPAQHMFVANPATGSRHNRGCAVDLTLYDLRTGRAVEMPGTYDEFSRRSYPAYPGGTDRQRWFRERLRTVMEAEGFTVNSSEWWHFDYRDWRRYRIGNTPFERLGR